MAKRRNHMTLNRANNRIKKAIRLIAVMSVTALSFIHISAASAQTPVDETAFSSLRFRSREEYVAFIKPIAKKVGLKYDYLPSVLAAQCIQETGYGALLDANAASLIRYHNYLGMKTDMLNHTWSSHTVWKGKSYLKKTPEWYGGVQVYITDSFRIYKSVEQGLIDYVMFMKWAKRADGTYKYRNDVIGNPSYQKTIRAVRINGYCTDPLYDKSVCNIIRQWNLTELDNGFGIHVERVKLSRTKTLKLKKGRSYKLRAKVIPENACDSRIRWKSSNEAVAAVSSNGKVTGRKRGTAYIYAISRENSSIRASVKVKIG